MKLKKLSALLLAGAMCVSIAACSGGTSSTPAPTGSSAPAETGSVAASDLSVAVFYYNYSDVYISSVRNNMDTMLSAMGITPDNYDGAGNQSQQTDQINTAIANGANLLIVNIVETSSPDAAQNAVDAAKAADIPIIFFNREVDSDVVNSYEKCAFVGTDAPEAGHMQGKMIGDYLVANFDTVDLNGDGKISYVMFKGQEGNAEAEYRTQYSVEDCDKLLTEGNTVATLDELYIWLSNFTAVEYIRNSLKRVRKKESALILASQNLEDFDQPGIRELTRPLFAIPTHQFLFNAGSVDKRFYMENLQLEPSEFELIRYPQRGVCLYKCGNERYLLEVHAPPYKEKLFGTAGGR